MQSLPRGSKGNNGKTKTQQKQHVVGQHLQAHLLLNSGCLCLDLLVAALPSFKGLSHLTLYEAEKCEFREGGRFSIPLFVLDRAKRLF